MFLGMIEGLIGFVVMNGPVVLMVMVRARIVLHHVLQLVNERHRAGSRRQATLHGETIQRQAQQQQEADDAAQKNHQVNLERL